jgi:hypothetical protein
VWVSNRNGFAFFLSAANGNLQLPLHRGFVLRVV